MDLILKTGGKRIGKIKDLNDEYVNTEILENLQLKINLNIKEDASIEVIENG